MGGGSTTASDVHVPLELWRRHPGRYAGYDVSTFGNVRNATTLRPLKLYPFDRKGYVRVLVCLPGRPKRRGRPRSRGSRRVAVARLVLETWVGPQPDSKPFALHDDGDSTHCRLANLYWGDRLENAADLARHRAERATFLLPAEDGPAEPDPVVGDAYEPADLTYLDDQLDDVPF